MCLLFQINTNGFVAAVLPPAEGVYLGKMPASFKMVAALLGDMDTSDGQGNVYYRKDSSQAALSRAAKHIRQAFPRDDSVEPTSAFIVTWENMAAQGTSSRGDKLDAKVRDGSFKIRLIRIFVLYFDCVVLSFHWSLTDTSAFSA